MLVRIYAIGFMFFFVGSATAGNFPFNYLALADGFDYQYLASLDALPENATPAWTNSSYDGTKAWMDNGNVTSERVLVLDHTTGNSFANYSLSSTGGSGTNEDLITMDFRFRLRETTVNGQWSLAVLRPPTPFESFSGATENLYYMRFATGDVTTLRDGTYTATNYSFGNDWNDARVTIDVGRARAKLYVNGSLSPLAEWRGSTSSSNSRNFIQFGDGSSSIDGGVELSHLKWSNDVLAVPMEDGTGSYGSEVGRRLEITGHRTIFSDSVPDHHFNFTFVNRFDDDTMWMSYSKGEHLVSEVTQTAISVDNGDTWSTPTISISPSNVHQFASGTGPLNSSNEEMRIVAANMWSGTPGTQHILFLNRWVTPTSQKETLPGGSGRFVTFPFETTVFATRSMIELDNGDLLLTAYGKATADTKSRVMALRSTDQGDSWSYLSTIGYISTTEEGFTEPTVTQLKDGSLFAMMRTGGGSDIWQARSLDGGTTWFDHHAIAENFGTVDPHLIVLENGTLVATAGRPTGVYLLVDYTGTGEHWQSVDILDSDHITSGYTSLVEYEPNKVMLFYDWSGLTTTDLPAAELPNRIIATTITFHVPEPSSVVVLGLLTMALVGRRVRGDLKSPSET